MVGCGRPQGVGQNLFEQMKEKTDRDWWLSPTEAVDEGFIDKVITKLSDVE